ncbi:MAG: nuclear transport factor 2 family protein [Hyphomonas sp.]|nr:nuclear transport factor 2 family protein [Hyphomonas sp.]
MSNRVPETDLAIKTLLQDYAAAWSELRADAIAAHWDRSDPEPLYLAEEIPAAMVSWDEVNAYWAHNDDFHRKVSLDFGPPAIKHLGDGVACLVMEMNWQIAFRNFTSKAMAGSNRVLAIVRDTEEGWKFISWVEAPLAPIMYFRNQYENAVTPEFLSDIADEDQIHTEG